MSNKTISKTERSTGASPSTGLSRALKILKSRFSEMIAAHDSRAASLRVYSAKRTNHVPVDPDSNRPAAACCDPETAASSGASDADAGFFTRVKNRIMSVYRMHETRVAALRVYDRKRVDCAKK